MKTSDIVRGIAFSAVTALAASALPFAGPASAAAPIVLKGHSADGDAFDLDEYVDGEITVMATDAGQPVDATRQLQYRWDLTPFGGAPTQRSSGVQTTSTGGEFAVPLPDDNQVSGTYALAARLVAAPGGRTGPFVDVLTVDAGQAATGLDAPAVGEPWWLDAGQDNDVTGSLTLENGAPLAERAIDLTFTGATAGGDDTPDAAFDPAQVLTGEDGTFTGVLRDTPGEGTELGGTIEAVSALGSASRAADLVLRTLADGSTLDVDAPAAGTPGEALDATATVVDGGGAPIEGQVVDLSLDHGFFTSAPQPIAGQEVGNLDDEGQTLTALTDEDGKIASLVGIGRDTDFDDDGVVTATLTAAAGDVQETARTTWSTADSLNGQVVIEPSPAGEQDGPVGPTVAGQRTYLEVHAQDQFGNRIAGQPIDLAYSGNLDDYDYSEDFTVSDFDTDGDIWVTSFEGGDSTVTGSWDGAPVTTYDGLGGVDRDVDEVEGAYTVSYYDLDFSRSRFSMTSNPARLATTGSAVTQTVRVIDQMGNPVVGYDVDFFRFGPTPGRGEVRKQTTTNRRGEARYTFVANRVGRTKITAEVTDGVDSRTLTRSLDFREPAGLRLTAGKAGPGADELTVTGPRRAAGAKVAVYRVVGDRLTVVASRRLDDAGRLSLSVRDRNGRKPTTYVAKLRATDTTAPATSRSVTLR